MSFNLRTSFYVQTLRGIYLLMNKWIMLIVCLTYEAGGSSNTVAQHSCNLHHLPIVQTANAITTPESSLLSSCDELSMEYNGINELYQMEYSWKLIESRKHPLEHLNQAKTSFSAGSASASSTASSFTSVSPRLLKQTLSEYSRNIMYNISSPAVHDENNARPSSCFKFVIQEREINNKLSKNKIVFGGSSFLVTVKGDTLRLCAVVNSFDGNYTVYCPRPKRNTCVELEVVLEWENFEAYHNSIPGGGTIALDSGGMRSNKDISLLKEQYCELADVTTHSIHHQGLWVKREIVEKEWDVDSPHKGKYQLEKALMMEFAPWQHEWVWENKCGRLQRHSKEKSDFYRQCFRDNDLVVDFIGGSHLNYLANCFWDEIFRYYCTYVKLCQRSERHTSSFALEAERLLSNEGRKNFFEGVFVKDKALFQNLTRCGDRPQYCLNPVIPQDMIHFFEHDADGFTAFRGSTVKTTTLGSAVSMLHMIYLNIPPHITPDNPYSSSRVVVIMSGHWDAASQRDPRSYILGELPLFFDMVSRIRQDPRTAQMRVMFSTGPAFSGGQTSGWRNNHALAATNAFIIRELSKRPELKIEFLEPSFLQMTLPRFIETADLLHYLVHGNSREREIGFAGDLQYCPGSVGQSFARIFLDQICDFY